MGTYTEFYFKAKLRKDTPQEIIDLFKRVIIDRDLGHDKNFFHSSDVFVPDLEHEFFKCDRWYMLLLATDFNIDKKGGQFYMCGAYWCLELDCEFKNYDNEIDKFINFISPFVVGRKKKQYLGWERGEWTHDKTYIHKALMETYINNTKSE